MGVLDVQHPEIIKFIQAKREDGVLRFFNLSIGVHDFILDKLLNDKPIELWHWKHIGKKDQIGRPDLANLGNIKVISGDDLPYYHPNETLFSFAEDHSECLHGDRSPDDVFEKVVHTEIGGAELYDIIMKSTYDYAEPGILNLTQINKMNPLSFAETINQTNPCLHPDSLVETVEGRVRIKNIKEPTNVYTMLDDGSLGVRKCTPSWISKHNAETIKITVDNEESVTCTPCHKIYVENVGWVKAKDLSIGDSLVHLCRSRMELVSEFPDGNKVVCIEKGPVTDVYDMTVEDTHNFIANFIVVHNCGMVM